MQKVYLLLRNNLQTGPYSLDEVVQLNLKSSDLVWVEGKSCGWSFPHEVAALKPYVPQPEAAVLTPVNNEPISVHHKNYLPPEATLPQPAAAPAKHIYVSLPGNTMPQTEVATPEQTFAQKAEAIRQRAQTYAAPTESVADDSLHTGYKRSLTEVEEDYTSWMVKQKKKKKTVQPWMVAGGVLMLLMSVVFLIMRKPSGNNTQPFAHASQQVTGNTAALVNTVPAVLVEEKKGSEKSALVKKIKSSNTIAAINTTTVAKQVQHKKIIQPVEQNTQPAVKEENIPAQQPNNNEQPTSTEQPKKKLADKIDGFFNKFKIKKEKDEPVEVPQTTTNNTGERQATHRTEKTATPEVTEDVKSLLTITSNEADENWMVGVRGLKITLHNRSNSNIKKATVAVNYYNEDNDLLDKKTVSFANIPAGKQLTVAAPDHRLADHTTYQLVTAE